MTQSEFHHFLTGIKGLTPAQVRQLRQQLDKHHAQAKKPARSAPADRAELATAPTKQRSIEELHQKMMARGLIRRLPDPSLDIDDDEPDDQPVPIKGEPLSETILRERR